MKIQNWYLSYNGERLTNSPLSYEQAEKQQNACIMNFGYKPDILLEKDKNELSISDFNIGDKIQYRYSGYGPKWIYQADGEVIRLNKKSITVELLYGNDKFKFQVAPYELTIL